MRPENPRIGWFRISFLSGAAAPDLGTVDPRGHTVD
jgi:hypothetical protein